MELANLIVDAFFLFCCCSSGLGLMSSFCSCQIGVGFGIAETLAIDFVVPMAKEVAIPLVKEVFNGVSRTELGPVCSHLTALKDCSSCRTNSLSYDHGFSLSWFPLGQQA
jgi:hypothetical protein